MTPEPFALTAHDRAQGLWLRLAAHLADMLAAARVRNDNEQLSEQETAALRGRIKCLKGLIALGDDRPALLTGEDETP